MYSNLKASVNWLIGSKGMVSHTKIKKNIYSLRKEGVGNLA